MTDIRQAKRALGREPCTVEGFAGVGIGDDVIRLYANAETTPVVKLLHDRWSTSYQGFAVSVVLTDGFKAQFQSP